MYKYNIHQITSPVDADYHIIYLSRRTTAVSWEDVLDLARHRQLVGYLEFYHDRTDQSVQLISIWVRPDQRRKGYGSQLLQRLIDWVETKTEEQDYRIGHIGVDDMSDHHRDPDERNIYRKMGFKYQDPEAGPEMYLNIRG